jgi:hypothetical protein
MTGSVEQRTSGQFHQVSSDFQPESDESRRDRALFFATALSIFCAKVIRSFISHCQPTEANPVDISEVTQGHSIKELVCITLLLALYEQQERESDWLKLFFKECWGRTDQLFGEPKSEDVISQASGLEGDDLCQITSMTLCHKLGLGSTVQDASIYISQLLANSMRFRSELLIFSLGAPLEELDEYIASAS